MADEITPSSSTAPVGESAPVAMVPAAAPAPDAKADDKPKGDSLDLALKDAFLAKEKKDKEAADPAPKDEAKDLAKAAPKVDEADPAKTEADEAAKAAEAAEGKPGAKKELQAPNSWSAPAKAKFGGLDPIVRNEILKRDRETVAGVQKIQTELAAIKPAFEDVDRAIGPYKAVFARRGITPGQAISQLIALSEHADKDFVGFVKEQAALRGLDLSQALQTAPGGSSAPQVDPEVAALKQKLASFETHLQTQATAQTQAKAEAEQRQIRTQVEAFQNEADAQGDLKHPHFELVKAHMGGLMSADPNLSMDGAYEQACWAHPEIREELQVKHSTEQEAKRKAEAEKAVNAAKSSLRGAPPLSPSTKAPVDPKNLDASLRFFTAKAMGEGVRL